MKNLKIKFGLFSLLMVLAASVFLTSCEQDSLIEPNDNIESISSLNQRVTENQNNRIHFEKAQKYIQIQRGKLVLDRSVKSIENFTDEEYDEIVLHLQTINDQVIGKTNITAEDVMNGVEYTITYKDNEEDIEVRNGCTGETKAEVTYTLTIPTGVTLYFDSCDTSTIITLGCGSLGLGISLIDGPFPVADIVAALAAVDCSLYLTMIVNENCNYGIIVRASVLYGLEYVQCQPAPGCLVYNSWNNFSSTGWIYVYEYPASWVWSNKYQMFIYMPNQTDICDYGLTFYPNNSICGRSGWMWDYNASDNTLWNWTGSGWASFSTGTCFTGLVAENSDIQGTYDNENIMRTQSSLNHNEPSDIISATKPEVLPEYLFSKTAPNQPTISAPSFKLDDDM